MANCRLVRGHSHDLELGVLISHAHFREIRNGIELFDKDGKTVGHSRRAAVSAISAVVFSRIIMCTPTLIGIPVLIQYLQAGLLKRRPQLTMPINLALCALLLSLATPLACAIFKQTVPVRVAALGKYAQVHTHIQLPSSAATPN